MNHATTTQVKKSLTKIFMVITVGFLLGTTAAGAQEKLGNLVAEAGFDWMVGRWTAKTDDGQEIEVLFRWTLDRHLATVDFKMGEYASHSMIYYDPVEQKIVEVGVDNRGGTGKGTWDIEDEKAVSKSDRRAPDGQTMKVAMLHSKVNAKTMKLAVYAIDDSGERADEPWATLDFKRQTNAPKKATNK